MNLLINIDVDDLPRATAFYCAAFDLTVGRQFGDGAVELLGGPAPIYLLAKSEGSSPCSDCESTAAARSYQRHWTPMHLDIVVDDIEAAIRKAVAAGAVQEKPTAIQAWGKLALMADPFGHGFCFVQFLGRGYDELLTGASG